MADYKTAGTLSNPNTKFTSTPVRAKPDVREEQLNTLIQGGSAAAQIAGKSYAAKKGAEMTGADLTQEEVHDTAQMIDQEIESQFVQESTAVEGPLQDTRVLEIKDQHLSEFANNDRVLLALRDQGTISTTEARGRRQLNLSRALSNPINALFKKDFLNAASSLTGGGTGAANAYFINTPEEERAIAIKKAQTDAEAKFEGAIAGDVAIGIPEYVSRRERLEEANAQLIVADFERKKKLRTVTGEDFANTHGTMRNSASRGIFRKLTELSTANNGMGVLGDSYIQVERMLDQQYNAFAQAINENAVDGGKMDIGQAERTAELERLKSWYDGMKESIKLYDAAAYDEKVLTQYKNFANKEGWEVFPELMLLNSINPKMAELVMVQGGVTKALDRFIGPGTSTKITNSANRVRALRRFAEGKPPVTSADAAITVEGLTAGGTKEGIEYVASPEVQENAGTKAALRTAYHNAPAMSLQAYSTVDAQRVAPQNEAVRNEMATVMDISRKKINMTKDIVGAGDALIEVTYQDEAPPQWEQRGLQKRKVGGSPSFMSGEMASARKNTGRGQRERLYLNLPDSMKDNIGDIQAMHNFVTKQPWSWEHVKDDYIDATDAFNGYMRGEWDVNDGMQPEPKADVPVGPQEKDIGRVEKQDIDKGTPLNDVEAQMNNILTDVLEQDLSEEALYQKLTQIQEIRSRNRKAGGPLKPGPISISEAKRDAETVNPDVVVPDQKFEEIAPQLLKYEGGFQNDPDDKGNYVNGKLVGTNMGVSAAQYKRLFGSEPTEEKLKALTPEKVKAAYKEHYWDANKVDQMPPEVQEIAFNMYIMTSPKEVTKAIQRASGAKEDGVMGPQTLKAMRGVTSEEIWEEYHKYLKTLKNYGKFGKGWRNRYEDII